MKLTLEHIDRTINNLDRLMPAKLNKNSTREYSLKEGIFLIAPKLMEKRDMGCTTNELIKALSDDGIVIKAATLNHYLCEYQKRHQGETGTQPDQGGSDSGSEKTAPVNQAANRETLPVNQEKKDTPNKERPVGPSQSEEKPNSDFRQYADKPKPEPSRYAEKPKPEFGLSEKRGDHAQGPV